MPEYIPQVDDYVVWDRGEYGRDEGWVYFYADEYITIETGVKPRPKCEYTDARSIRHHFIHTLLLCGNSHWNQLKYIRTRKCGQLELDLDLKGGDG